MRPLERRFPTARRIENVTIRGQASAGMLCSTRELALPERDDGGILILPADAPVGAPLVEYLRAEDTVLELGRDAQSRRLSQRPRHRPRGRRAHRGTPQAVRDESPRGGPAGAPPGACRRRGPGSLSALLRAGGAGCARGAVATVAAHAPRDGRHAPDQQRRRRHQLRHAGTRAAAARLRPGAPRGRVRHRPPRRKHAALHHPRRRRAPAHGRRPRHRRRAGPGRARRRDGRRRLGDPLRPPPTCCSKARSSRPRPSAVRRAGSA